MLVIPDYSSYLLFLCNSPFSSFPVQILEPQALMRITKTTSQWFVTFQATVTHFERTLPTSFQREGLPVFILHLVSSMSQVLCGMRDKQGWRPRPLPGYLMGCSKTRLGVISSFKGCSPKSHACCYDFFPHSEASTYVKLRSANVETFQEEQARQPSASQPRPREPIVMCTRSNPTESQSGDKWAR